MRVSPRLIAFVLAVAGLITLWLVPFYRTQLTVDGSGPKRTRVSYIRFYQVRGIGPLEIVGTFVPVLIAAVPLVRKRTRYAAGAVLLAFAVLGAITIGLFYLPAAIFLLLPFADPLLPRIAA